MGISSNHALGRSRKFFVEYENTAGTFVKPTGAGAVKALATQMAMEFTRSPRMDSRQSRSLFERITGKSKATWSAEGYVIPSGTAGTPPDAHQLFYAACGAYANTPATQDLYTLSSSQTIRTLSLCHHFDNVYSESVWGAVVESLTLSGSGGDPFKWKAEGAGMGYVRTTPTTLNGAMSGSTTMILTDGWAAGKNSVVMIDDSTDRQVTVDTSRPSFTVDTSTTESNGATVVPWTPTETTTGSPISGILGGLTIGGVSVPVTAFEMTIKNNFKPLEDVAFEEFPSDFVPVWREVTGKATIRAKKEQLIYLANTRTRTAAAQVAIAITLGNVAGAKVLLTIGQAEYDTTTMQVPEAEEGTFELPFTAVATSSGEDECSIKFF